MLRLFFICFCVFAIQKEERTITWNASHKLLWTDFKGPINADSDAVATTASGITFGYSIKKSNEEIIGFKTKISADFYPDKSWYKPELADSHILGHEQHHFNITELHARKFRERVSKLKPNLSLNSNLDKIHQEVNQELSNFQKLYDAETDFSRNYEKQVIWEIKIQQELDKLKQYESK